MKLEYKNVDDYIAAQPAEVRPLLQQFREAIKKAAPLAEEVISYQMPAYKQDGMLVYFAAWKKHIGFYPTSSGVREFAPELADYAGAKGSVQFPLHQPLPLALVTKIVKYRVKENKEKAKAKAAKKAK